MHLLWMKSDYIIPPDTGGKIRTYNLLRELNKLCDVTYLSFKSSTAPNVEAGIRECASEVMTIHRAEEDKSGLSFYGRVLKGLASSQPYTVQKYRSGQIVGIQRTWLESHPDEPAVILCDFLEMSENVSWSLPCPKVLFQHNVESVIWSRHFENEGNPAKRAYFNLERRRMTRYEAAACNRFDLVFTVSEKDRAILRDGLGVSRPIEVLETGVDTEYFSPCADVRPTPGKLLFLGSMDWMPNIDGARWFVQEVYPAIKSDRPEVTLDIVGRRPTEEIIGFARQDGSIRVSGDVPDVRRYIAEADLFIVPLRIGGGTRIKIYEAMAMACPVVSTTVGAEGLPLEPDRNIVIGDSPIEFAQQVRRLLEAPSVKEAVAEEGYRFVSENCSWKNVAMKLHDRCAQLAQIDERQEET